MAGGALKKWLVENAGVSGSRITTRGWGEDFEIGCRIPKEYFWVIGWGESDVGTEIGSYDAALHMAGIEHGFAPRLSAKRRIPMRSSLPAVLLAAFLFFAREAIGSPHRAHCGGQEWLLMSTSTQGHRLS